jgi:hypothetical protein
MRWAGANGRAPIGKKQAHEHSLKAVPPLRLELAKIGTTYRQNSKRESQRVVVVLMSANVH